jgi:hypothetical protein
LGQVFWYTDLGTTNLSTATPQYFLSEYTSQTNPTSTMPIFAFNAVYRQYASTGFSAVGGFFTTSSPIGMAVVQNLVENNYTNETQSLLSFSSDASSATPVNNVMIWNNTTAGGRQNRCYNDGTDSGGNTTARFKANWSEVGNLIDQDAIKSDTFNTPSAARIGNWYCLYGVGRKNSMTAMMNIGSTGFTASPDFATEFPGANSYQLATAVNANGTSTTNPIALTSGSGSPYSTVSAAMTGATATFTKTGNYSATYTVGQLVSVYGCSVGGYNLATWTLASGGSGTTSFTATSPGVTGLASATGCTVGLPNLFSYNKRLAWDGTYAGVGYGDYRVLSNSIANSMVGATQQVLPYDFAGIIRDNRAYGAAGAYEQTALPQVFLTF